MSILVGLTIENEMKIAVCIFCRAGSKRLPNKAFLDLAGYSALGLLLQRAKVIQDIADVILCTSSETEDDEVANLAGLHDVDLVRGNLKDVLSRIEIAIRDRNVSWVVRVTADNPFTDFASLRNINLSDFLRTDRIYIKDLARGLRWEALSVASIRHIVRHITPAQRRHTEYLTYFYTDNDNMINAGYVTGKGSSSSSFTLDTMDDYGYLCKLLRSKVLRDRVPSLTVEELMKIASLHEPHRSQRSLRPNISFGLT